MRAAPDLAIGELHPRPDVSRGRPHREAAAMLAYRRDGPSARVAPQRIDRGIRSHPRHGIRVCRREDLVEQTVLLRRRRPDSTGGTIGPLHQRERIRRARLADRASRRGVPTDPVARRRIIRQHPRIQV